MQLVNWSSDEVTELAKADKLCCAFFRPHMQSQGCMPIAHTGIITINDLEGAQRIIAAYAEKKKTWEEANS